MNLRYALIIVLAACGSAETGGNERDSLSFGSDRPTINVGSVTISDGVTEHSFGEAFGMFGRVEGPDCTHGWVLVLNNDSVRESMGFDVSVPVPDDFTAGATALFPDEEATLWFWGSDWKSVYRGGQLSWVPTEEGAAIEFTEGQLCNDEDWESPALSCVSTSVTLNVDVGELPLSATCYGGGANGVTTATDDAICVADDLGDTFDCAYTTSP